MTRTTRQYAREKNEEERKKKKRGWDLEDIQIERPTSKQRYVPLNQRESVFSSAMSTGINTEESVFDKGAVFRVTHR